MKSTRSGAALPFHFVIVVWGEEYVNTFLQVALPCYLAPHNLPGLGNLGESRFLIVTTAQDRARMEQSGIYRLLRETVETVFVEAPWLADDIPYQSRAARGHRVAAELAARHDAYCVYLCPDFLLSDGSLQSLERSARAGRRAVLVPGLRLVTESAIAELKQAGWMRAGEPMVVPSRELVALALRHLHEEIRRANWEHPRFSINARLCTWDVAGEHGLLVRAFHLHPMLIAMRGSSGFSMLDRFTIDGDFLGHVITDWDEIHVETDSDNVAMFSLTRANDRPPPDHVNAASVALLREAAYSEAMNPLHRFYFSRAIRLHAGDLNESWDSLEHDTGRLAYEILEYKGNETAVRYIPARIMLRELRRRLVSRLRKALGASRGG